MELTEGGRILYASASRVLGEIEASLAQARDARRLVQVGICGSAPEHLLARVERIFGGDGSLDVEFAEADSQEQLDLLRTGILAFGVMRVFHAVEGLATLTLADEPLGVRLRSDHPLADRRALTWADLAGQELLWFPAGRNPRFAEYVLAHLAGHGWSPRLHVVDAHSHALYRHHLRTSQNLVTLQARNGITADAGMAWRPLAFDPPRQRFVLATPGDSPWAPLLAHPASRSQSRSQSQSRSRSSDDDGGITGRAQRAASRPGAAA
jgi:DNA-binding transcriptional LysR family regulator